MAMLDTQLLTVEWPLTSRMSVSESVLKLVHVDTQGVPVTASWYQGEPSQPL